MESTFILYLDAESLGDCNEWQFAALYVNSVLSSAFSYSIFTIFGI